MKRIEISENGINLVIDIDGGMARERHFSAQIFDERESVGRVRGLPFVGFRDELDRTGRLITLLCKNPETGGEMSTRYRFFNGICAAEVVTETSKNIGGDAVRRSNTHTELRPCGDGFEYRLIQDGTEGRTYRTLIAFGTGEDGFNSALGELTRCRRVMRRRTRDCKNLPVFFDGSGCGGDTDPLMPAASGCGCNFFRFAAGDGGRTISYMGKDIRGCRMTPALRVGSFADEGIEELLRETAAGNISAENCADYEGIDALHAKHRDLSLVCGLAGIGAAERGLLLTSDGDTAGGYIAAAPEQLLVRCEVRETADRGEAAAVMIRGMLARIELCGRIDRLHPKSLAVIKEGIEVYKRIRYDIRDGLPMILNGSDEYPAIRCADGRRVYVALHGSGSGSVTVNVPCFSEGEARCIYPSFFGGSVDFSAGKLTVTFGSGDEAALIMLETEA